MSGDVATVVPGTLVARSVGSDLAFGPKAGRAVLFGRQADDVHICVGPDDLGVSRRHGVLSCDGVGWSLRNLGRRPLRLPTGELHTNAEPAPLAIGYTPVVVPGFGDRQHLLEIYVVGADGGRPTPRPDHETHRPTIWPLDDAERLVVLVLGQRYLRNEPFSAAAEPARCRGGAGGAGPQRRLDDQEGRTPREGRPRTPGPPRRPRPHGAGGAEPDRQPAQRQPGARADPDGDVAACGSGSARCVGGRARVSSAPCYGDLVSSAIHCR